MYHYNCGCFVESLQTLILLNLVPRLRRREAILPLLHTSSWCGTYKCSNSSQWQAVAAFVSMLHKMDKMPKLNHSCCGLKPCLSLVPCVCVFVIMIAVLFFFILYIPKCYFCLLTCLTFQYSQIPKYKE